MTGYQTDFTLQDLIFLKIQNKAIDKTRELAYHKEIKIL